jgi:hypothetical protein
MKGLAWILHRDFVTFVLFVVIKFLTTKDTKRTKEEAHG